MKAFYRIPEIKVKFYFQKTFTSDNGSDRFKNGVDKYVTLCKY